MKIEVYPHGGEWHWRIKSGNGTVVGHSAHGSRHDRTIQQAQRIAAGLDVIVYTED